MYVIQFTDKQSEMGKSLQIRHKRESGNKNFARHFKSLGVNYMTAHDHYYAIIWTILFNTILGRACDVLSRNASGISMLVKLNNIRKKDAGCNRSL